MGLCCPAPSRRSLPAPCRGSLWLPPPLPLLPVRSQLSHRHSRLLSCPRWGTQAQQPSFSHTCCGSLGHPPPGTRLVRTPWEGGLYRFVLALCFKPQSLIPIPRVSKCPWVSVPPPGAHPPGPCWPQSRSPSRSGSGCHVYPPRKAWFRLSAHVLGSVYILHVIARCSRRRKLFEVRAIVDNEQISGRLLFSSLCTYTFFRRQLNYFKYLSAHVLSDKNSKRELGRTSPALI